MPAITSAILLKITKDFVSFKCRSKVRIRAFIFDLPAENNVLILSLRFSDYALALQPFVPSSHIRSGEKCLVP